MKNRTVQGSWQKHLLPFETSTTWASPNPSALGCYVDAGTQRFWSLSKEGESNKASSSDNLICSVAQVSVGMNEKYTMKTSPMVGAISRKLQTLGAEDGLVSTPLLYESGSTVICGYRFRICSRPSSKWSTGYPTLAFHEWKRFPKIIWGPM